MPIVYPAALIPEAVRAWLPLNPPYLFIESIRRLLLEQQLPPLWAWTMMLGWILLFGLAGVLIMRSLQSEIRDSL
jgi:ABC-type polysaccharide/polyol phosphate export permease